MLKAAIRRLTCKIELVPVLCGSAFKKKGVQPLLDAVVDYLPSPLDVPPARRHRAGHGQRRHGRSRTTTINSARWRSSSGPIVYAGKLVFFRVYSGQLKKGDTIYNPRTRKRERVSRLMIIQGSERKDIDQVFAGDIAALVGLRNITTGDTLVRRGFRRDARTADVPRAGHQHGRRAEDESRTARKWPKACSAWRRKTRRSAAFTNEETGQLIIAGMGELHLEIIIDRLKREFKVDANTGAPQIAYRETITKAGRGRRQIHPPIRRPRPIRPRLRQGRSRNEKGKGVEIRQQDRRRRDSQGIHSGGHRRHRRSLQERRLCRLPGH